jgi:hypothetical protein
MGTAAICREVALRLSCQTLKEEENGLFLLYRLPFGQVEIEGRSNLSVRLEPTLTARPLNDGFTDAESQAGATFLSSSCSTGQQAHRQNC